MATGEVAKFYLEYFFLAAQGRGVHHTRSGEAAKFYLVQFYLLLKGEESITPVATGEVAKFYPG